MLKNNLMKAMLVFLIALIIIGLVLMIIMAMASGKNIINVDLDDGEPDAVKFENLCLLPGEECEYFIYLNSGMDDKTRLTLDFNETQEKTLKNYAYIRIEADGNVICDKLMAEVFDDDELFIDADFARNENTSLKVVFYLPSDVGNEAQNAEAIFELLITVNNR